jgi:hypothetical protein
MGIPDRLELDRQARAWRSAGMARLAMGGWSILRTVVAYAVARPRAALARRVAR